ncbi:MULTISPECIES: hypothetical protein [Metallosphaera]|uniref:hypothetical protein n=1 Tax=Metallosphaera TaxID=41980 RepID=UPI002989FAE7|nr:hypothetical protein [Metallosphaera sedula]MCP6729963.1 hypothetical protein [Metallosphaera sedula]
MGQTQTLKEKEFSFRIRIEESDDSFIIFVSRDSTESRYVVRKSWIAYSNTLELIKDLKKLIEVRRIVEQKEPIDLEILKSIAILLAKVVR